MKFNKNEFGWKEKVNTDELVTKNDIPHYNETLITEISGEDYNFVISNNYFNMSALNIDETKSYIGEDINSDEEYKYKFVYNKESDALIDENSYVCIYNHKSYDGTNFTDDVNSAVITFGITPMVLTPEVEGYIRLYEVDKVELDNNCLPEDVNIKNSLTVGKRLGDVGMYSVAEGYRNTASGEYSHAEGDSTTASNYTSHAEGNGTTSSALASHAEGNYTTASGNSSHSEGNSTTASGVSSHTEGMSTTASGGVSHAEGNSTEASGTSSHAEGEGTTASGENSHAEGGSSNSISYVISDFSSSITNDTIIDEWSETKFSLAKGDSSHVEGKDCLALGDNSHAEGYCNAVTGNTSHAEGYCNAVTGNTSHAEGYCNAVTGNTSHAEGYFTTASGESSHAEGEASNLATDIIQDLSSSTSNDDILTAWNENSFSLAKGTSSHVEGKDNLALGDFSHAEGSNTTASGENSHTEGSNTTASGVVSHAEGESTIASGVVSHAEGFNTIASGNSSHAEGFNTIASGNSSHAEGFNTIASSGNQHVQGKYNIEDTENKYAHIVGNGTSDTARSNAHTLDWNGNGWYKGKLSQDGTPTEDKDLTTKKYVDDVIASQPTFSFNDSGELVVTINGVSKTFVPKQ